MSALLQYNKITYECSCGKWRALPYLYFCRHCFKIKCDDCICKEIDMIFCPRCLEVSSAPEARSKKHRCNNCNDCPNCGNVLSGRSENEKCYLICQNCRWSTRDSGEEDRSNTRMWPSKENPLTTELNEVIGYMKKLEVIENAPKELRRGKGSKTWSALHLKDKFGMQKMVEKRRNMLAPELKPLGVHEPTSAPSLEEDLENRSDLMRTLDQIVAQPLINSSEPLRPVKVFLHGRTLMRCGECERTLVKRDFGLATYKFKISSFAREFVPDIRLSRPEKPEKLQVGQTCHVLFSVTNLSLSTLTITITPQNGDGMIQCTTAPIDLVLPSRKEADAASVQGVPAEQSDIIVFRQHNRVGLRYEIIPSEDTIQSPILDLLITYTQDGAFSLLAAASEDVLKPEEARLDKVLTAHLRVSLA